MTQNSHFNGLTPAEAERLAMLIEAAAGVQKIACEILRHGYESCNPYDDSKLSNRKLLEFEVSDLAAVYQLMAALNDVDGDTTDERMLVKLSLMSCSAHHQSEDDILRVHNNLKRDMK